MRRVVIQSFYGFFFYDWNFKKLYSSHRGAINTDVYLKMKNDGKTNNIGVEVVIR